MSRIEIKQANFPAKVRRHVEQSLSQADRGETVSHTEAMKQVHAWRDRQGQR